MIDFDYSESAGWFGIHFALIAVIVSVVFYFVAGLAGTRIGFKKLEPGWYPSIFALIPVSILVGALVGIPAFWTVHEFRTLEVSSVSGLKIRPADSPDSVPVLYADAVQTKIFLTMLQNCRGVYHQHDTLFAGYTLEPLVENGASSKLYLDVYRGSTVARGRQTVIARYGSWEAGEYNCPQMQDWVKRNIDPLFKQ